MDSVRPRTNGCSQLVGLLPFLRIQLTFGLPRQNRLARGAVRVVCRGRLLAGAGRASAISSHRITPRACAIATDNLREPGIILAETQIVRSGAARCSIGARESLTTF